MNFSLKKINHLGCALLFSSALIFSQNSFAKDKPMEYKKQGMMGQGMMGQGMMGQGMMGQGMMGMCHLSASENVKTNITETSEGVTVTYTAKDKKDISRLQKMAQIAKLSQELKEEEALEKK